MEELNSFFLLYVREILFIIVKYLNLIALCLEYMFWQVINIRWHKTMNHRDYEKTTKILNKLQSISHKEVYANKQHANQLKSVEELSLDIECTYYNIELISSNFWP